PPRHLHAIRHRVGDGSLRGNRRLRDDLGRHEVDGPVAGRELARDRGRKAENALQNHAALGPSRASGRDRVRVCRDAWLVCGGAGPRSAGAFFRGHYSDQQYTLSYPPEYGKASALGLALFGVMFATLSFYRWVVRRGTFATISGRAFQPRPIDMGRARYGLA